MSITITGGISFSGGVGIVSPPSTVNAGYYGGGSISGDPATTSSIQRILFATDTATASIRGSFNNDTTRGSGTGNTTDGWFAGGMIGASTPLSMIQRITYSTDTATASVRGPLAVTARATAAASDGTTYGWFSGGYAPAPISAITCTVQRITFATDTATASTRGPLSAARRYFAGTGTSTSGWVGGGYGPYLAPPAIYAAYTTVQRITYATDTNTASVRGPLSAGGYGLAAVTDLTTYGWFGGGYSATAPYNASTVDRITYATDTATATIRGPLATGTRLFGATTDGTTYGWFGGGRVPGSPPTISTVQRITYATDTATAGVRGPLASAAYKFAGATSGIA
jgi:hypothetical protein